MNTPLLVLGGILLFPTVVAATEPIAATTQLTVTPVLYETVVSPGRTTSAEFSVTNQSAVPLPLKSYVRAWSAADEEGDITIDEVPDERRLAVTSWTAVTEGDFILPPQATRTVTVNFSPPADLPAGGYYATLFFEPLVPESFLSSGTSVLVGGRVGALLFLVGPGELQEEGMITDLAPRSGWWSLPLTVGLRFQNTGNTHLRPRGTITAQPLLFGDTSSSPVDEFTVLPGRARQRTAVLKQIRRPGVYKLTLTLGFSDGKKSVQQSTTVFFLPWSVVAGIILLLLVGFFALMKGSRQRFQAALAHIIRG